MFLILVFIAMINSCAVNLHEKKDDTKSEESELNIVIPTAGNSWVMNGGDYTPLNIITSEGIRNWTNSNHTIRTFFYLEKGGQVSLSIRAKVNTGNSKIEVTFQNNSQNIVLTGSDFRDTQLGDFFIEGSGYYFIDINGLEKDGTTYADLDAILLGADVDSAKFIKDDLYFGRRGPSVHLNFSMPEGVNQVEWFYSEIEIPENQDVIGSYFMANGFGEGYFGIQVNSSTERRILFSIWSPFQTDDPSEIPDEDKIKLLKKGAGVTTGEFGNEGSGGQSYKVFNWKTEVKYGFLLGAKPTGNGDTDYIAYFHDPQMNEWNLIAQFRRPKTNTYLKNLYSFLENFIPYQGVFERKGLYGNQWVYDSKEWHELFKAKFTADNTARKKNRLDYSGGIEGNGFYLKNCGFTNDKVMIDSRFERTKLNQAPIIDFGMLE